MKSTTKRILMLTVLGIFLIGGVNAQESKVKAKTETTAKKKASSSDVKKYSKKTLKNE